MGACNKWLTFTTFDKNADFAKQHVLDAAPFNMAAEWMGSGGAPSLLVCASFSYCVLRTESFAFLQLGDSS